MECYDISTFQGSLAVGSGVSMRDGEPDKAGYRRYKVKGVAGQDDFAMLHEVITRRLRRALAEGAMPDLLVIDGGKGQLTAALAAAQDLGVADQARSRATRGCPSCEMVGLAKSRLLDAAALSAPPGWSGGAPARRRQRAGLADAAERAGKGFVAEAARTPERVFLPGPQGPGGAAPELGRALPARPAARRGPPLRHHVPPQAAAGPEPSLGVLDEIPGIGELRRKALLRHFGSLRRVREATAEEIARVEGVGEAQARAVWDFFHRPRGREGCSRTAR